MNGLLDLRLLTLALDKLVEVLFVFGRETLDKFVGDLGLVHDGNVKVVGGFLFTRCTEIGRCSMLQILLVGVVSGAQAVRPTEKSGLCFLNSLLSTNKHVPSFCLTRPPHR